MQSTKKVRYDRDDDHQHFLLGMTFSNATEAREAIPKYSVAKGKDIRIKPNEPTKIRGRCKYPGCPFMVFISKDGKNGGMSVKTLNPEHNCFRVFKNSRATASFLANYFKEHIYKNPRNKVKDMREEAKQDMRLHVSATMCKRAKRIVINELEGSYTAEFSQLEAYADQVKRTNPGSSCEIKICKQKLQEGSRVFRRIFVCFAALKNGWRAGCRPIIGLDGCFLKGIMKGQVLVAIGKNRCNQNFPIAWAVTDKEKKVNWKWLM